MGRVGRAFSARDRGRSDGSPQLEKVLTDLHVAEQENDNLYSMNGTVAAPAPPPLPAAPAPPPVAQDPRERLEKLLRDARQIEQLLEKEAAEAALAENLKLEEKRVAVAKLAEAEGVAEAEARGLRQQSESAALQRAQLDTEVRTAQMSLSAAEDSVKHLEARLAEAQSAVIQTKLKLTESEGHARNAALQAEGHAAKVHEANARIARCREARQAAEAEVREAEAIANGIMQTAATLKQLKTLSVAGPKTAETSSENGQSVNSASS